jgi:hypothetical protein
MASPTDPVEQASAAPARPRWLQCLHTGFSSRTYARLRAVVTLVICAAVYAFGVRHVVHFTVDDAGITYAYARHAVEGLGLVAVPGGAVVEGYSNPAWTALLSVVYWLGFSIPVSAKVLGIALGFGTILLALRGLQIAEGRGWREVRWRDALLAVLIGMSPEVIFWLPAGLENGLLAALLLCLAWLDAREGERAGGFPYSVIAALAVALTRPEGAAYGFAIAGIKLTHALVSGRRWRAFFLYGVVFCLGLGAYHAWHGFVFHLPFPNTYYAKVPGLSWEKLSAGWDYYRQHAVASSAYLLGPLVLIGAVRRFRSKVSHVACIAVSAAFTLSTGGDWMPFGRFFAIGVPCAAVLAVAGLREVAGWVGYFTLRLRIGPEPVALVAALALGLFWESRQLDRLERIRKEHWCHYCNREDDIRAIQRIQADLKLPLASLVIHDFGAAAWASAPNFTPIDLLGLCDLTVARTQILRDRDKRPRSADRAKFQYLLHEQDSPPTFLYFPHSWWPELHKSAEVLQGYYGVSKAALGRNHRKDAIFAIHRSAFVDYFPPVDRLDYHDIGDHLALAGVGIRGKVVPGEAIAVALAVVQRSPSSIKQLSVCARLHSGGEVGEEVKIPLFPGVPAALREWEPGEPYLVESELHVPRTEALEVGLDVGIALRHEGCSWQRVDTLSFGEERKMSERPLPRFPSNLPAARGAALKRLETRVAQLLERRRRDRDVQLSSPDLSLQLEREAQRLEAGGAPEQAYLAYVLASQANRSDSVRWLDPLWNLRPLDSNHGFVMEMALLRRTYATGDAKWLWRLVQYYRSRDMQDRATYFADRAPGPPPCSGASEPLDCLRELDVWEDFEAGRMPSEWRLEGTGFGVVEIGLDDEPVFRGQQGRWLLSSYLHGSRQYVGAATSPPFEVGRAMSFLLGGSHRGVQAELVIDDEVVRAAAGPGSTQLSAVLWDVEEFRGRQARLRVADSSPQSYVVLDWVVLWD